MYVSFVHEKKVKLVCGNIWSFLYTKIFFLLSFWHGVQLLIVALEHSPTGHFSLLLLRAWVHCNMRGVTPHGNLLWYHAKFSLDLEEIDRKVKICRWWYLILLVYRDYICHIFDVGFNNQWWITVEMKLLKKIHIRTIEMVKHIFSYGMSRFRVL